LIVVVAQCLRRMNAASSGRIPMSSSQSAGQITSFYPYGPGVFQFQLTSYSFSYVNGTITEAVGRTTLTKGKMARTLPLGTNLMLDNGMETVNSV
jgi:hypothetical protein